MTVSVDLREHFKILQNLPMGCLLPCQECTDILDGKGVQGHETTKKSCRSQSFLAREKRG